ncbi:hypothetical protein [uncultured Pantoea sp.]|uniref:hypothetical protein n=1 Tax=uncultured Pantoea sp. TaxID=218084 RepID=UPI0028041159|nr:hypothetical protein [uncultured Pantoea sp.]
MMEQRWSRQPLPKTSLALQTRRAGATQTHSRVRRSQPSQSVSQSASQPVSQSASQPVSQSASQER